MADILDFMACLKAKAGDAAFMHCPACESPALGVVVRWRGSQPYIAALVCEDCPTEIGVQDGTPVGWTRADA
jgi:hypothetical protein